MADDTYLDAPCANSDDPDAWFVNRRGRLDPEDRREIEEQYEPAEAETIIADLERTNRRRLRMAIRSCYFDCPMATRLKCLEDGLEERYGVRGGYPEDERARMVAVRDEYRMTGRAVAEVAISQDRREALLDEEGDGPAGDQPDEPSQPRDESTAEAP